MKIRHHSPALIDPTSESVRPSPGVVASLMDSGGMTWLALLTILLLVAFVPTGLANALAPDPSSGGYLRKAFSVEDGLPDNQVNAIIQSPNGFLWIGTD